jgi:hypothetical protein
LIFEEQHKSSPVIFIAILTPKILNRVDKIGTSKLKKLRVVCIWGVGGNPARGCLPPSAQGMTRGVYLFASILTGG